MNMADALLNMFRQATPEGRLVCATIGLLFLAGLASVAYNFRRMLQERQLLDKVMRRRLHRLDRNDPADVFRTLGLAPEAADTVLGRSLSLLRGGHAPHEAGLYATASFLDGVRGTRNAFAQYLATIFLLLGLAGTVLGLGGALFQMVPALDVGDFSRNKVVDVVKGLTGTLGQMQTVFGATLAGLLASILLGGANAVYSWWETRVLGTIEEYVYGEVAPVLLHAEKEDIGAALGALPQSVTQIVDATQELQQTSKATLDGLVGATKEWQGSTQQFAHQVETLGGHLESLQSSQRELLDAHGQVHGLLEKVQQREASVQELLEELGSRILTAADAVSGASASVQAGQADLAGTLQGAIHVLANVRDQSAQAFAQIAGDAREHIQSLSDSMTAHVQGTQKTIERHVNEQVAAVREAVVREQAMVEQIGQRLEGLIAKEGEARIDLQQALLGLIESVEERTAEALEAVPEVSDEVASRLAHSVSMADEQIERLVKSLAAEVAEAIGSRMSEALASLRPIHAQMPVPAIGSDMLSTRPPLGVHTSPTGSPSQGSRGAGSASAAHPLFSTPSRAGGDSRAGSWLRWLRGRFRKGPSR